MGLKEELQKIVSAEREEIDDKEDAQRDYHAEQKKRFVVLGNLLRELGSGLGHHYGEIKILENHARIEIGHKKEGDDTGSRNWDIKIEVKPDYDINLRSGGFTSVEGFRLEQKQVYATPDRELSETIKKFSTEEAVMEYLLKEIGKKVARYQHSDELAAKRDDQPRSDD